MIPGITDRQEWMLVVFVLVATLFSCINFHGTKYGMSGGNDWRKLRAKPVLIGVGIGVLLWALTQSGGLVTHEEAVFMAATFGSMGEKAIALLLNKNPKLNDRLRWSK